MNTTILSILTGLGGYLSGSVMYAYLLPRILFHVDVRNYGDGNPGAFNVHLCTSMPLAFLAAALDVLKGMIPAAFARYVLELPDWAMLLPLAGPMLGHLYPPMLHFHGGKGICTAFGVMIGLMPGEWYALLWAACILLLLPMIRDHRKLILASLALFTPLCFVIGSSAAMNLCMVVIAVLVASRHLQDHTAGEAES